MNEEDDFENALYNLELTMEDLEDLDLGSLTDYALEEEDILAEEEAESDEVLDLIKLREMSPVEQQAIDKLIAVYLSSFGNYTQHEVAVRNLRANGMLISREAYETKRKLAALTD